MSATIITFSPDAALIASEAEYRQLVAECDRLAERDQENEALDQRLAEVEATIADTTPRTFAGAAVKLRMLIDLGQRGWDISRSPALPQVLALVEDMSRQQASAELAKAPQPVKQSSAAEPPAETEPPDIAGADADEEMRSLFGQWVEIFRQRDMLEDDAAEAIVDGFYEQGDIVERRIYDLPARGPIGIAIKGYLVSRYFRIDYLRWGDPCVSLGSFDPDNYTDKGSLSWPWLAVRSFAEDAVRVLPELAPLVAGVVDAPVSLGKVLPLRPRER